jgi:uncharacterized protein YkwD
MKTAIHLAITLCILAGVATMAPVTAQGEVLRQVGGSGGSGDNPCWDYKNAERGFARRINAARLLGGLAKLSLDPELSRVARKHTQEMWGSNELYHTPSDKLRKRITKWTVIGENVGVGGTVSSLHEAFMNSPAHRDNILYTTFRHVGIGTSKRQGRLWVTVIFEGVADPGTTLSMPTC